jgi:hypothetical protein
MKKALIVLFAVLSIGCTGAAFDEFYGHGQITVTKDHLNASTDIKLTPAHTAGPDGSLNTLKIGARWDSSTPTFAVLDLSYKSNSSGTVYLSYNSVDFNVDGDRYELDSGRTSMNRGEWNEYLGAYDTFSEATVIISMDRLDRIMSAKNAVARFYTSDGYIDVDLKALEQENGMMILLASRLIEFRQEISNYQEEK